jgi:hypothetical protein
MAKKVDATPKKPEICGSDTMRDTLSQFVGQPIAILCARFNYRGILSHVAQDHVILAQARAVESSGASSQERPSNEDSIGSSVIISLNAVELVYWPNWAYANLDD